MNIYLFAANVFTRLKRLFLWKKKVSNFTKEPDGTILSEDGKIIVFSLERFKTIKGAVQLKELKVPE